MLSIDQISQIIKEADNIEDVILSTNGKPLPIYLKSASNDFESKYIDIF